MPGFAYVLEDFAVRDDGLGTHELITTRLGPSSAVIGLTCGPGDILSSRPGSKAWGSGRCSAPAAGTADGGQGSGRPGPRAGGHMASVEYDDMGRRPSVGRVSAALLTPAPRCTELARETAVWDPVLGPVLDRPREPR